MTTIESLLQQTEADILNSFERFGSQFDKFSDLVHIIDFSSENSEQVRSFLNGLYSLQAAFGALIEATKVVAEVKGVDFN